MNLIILLLIIFLLMIFLTSFFLTMKKRLIGCLMLLIIRPAVQRFPIF